MKKVFRICMAILRRNFIIRSSYRMSLALDLAGILAAITTFFFVAKIFGKGASTYLAEFGGDYFPFVLVGLAFSVYLSSSLTIFSRTLGLEQSEGTLEAVLLAPAGIHLVLICSALISFLSASLRVVVYLAAGWLIFGFDLSRANFLPSIAVLFLTALSFGGLGILSAAFLLVFKRGDPVEWLFGGASKLLGGVYFPVTVLPVWVQKFSEFLPITHSLRAVRETLINGAGFSKISVELAVLAIFTAVTVPIGIFCFSFALDKARRDGSLLFS